MKRFPSKSRIDPQQRSKRKQHEPKQKIEHLTDDNSGPQPASKSEPTTPKGALNINTVAKESVSGILSASCVNM